MPLPRRLTRVLEHRFVHSTIRSGLLFSVLAGSSWLAGVPFIWPSLGPTTYALVFERDTQLSFKNIFGAHAIGALSGLATHALFASHVTIKSMAQPLGHTSFRVALSSIVALSLTVGLMRLTRWTHSPACATTLITALGLISGFADVGFLMAAVVMVYLTHLLTEQLFGHFGWVESQG